MMQFDPEAFDVEDFRDTPNARRKRRKSSDYGMILTRPERR